MLKPTTKTVITVFCATIIVVLFLTSESAFSQNGYWRIGSGNPCPTCAGAGSDGVDNTNNFIGTDTGNATPIILGAYGDTTQLFLDVSGKVGIGITVPVFKFDVKDNTGSILADTIFTPTDTIIRTATITGNFLASNPNSSFNVGVKGESKDGPNNNTGVTGIAWTIADATDTLRNFGVSGHVIGGVCAIFFTLA